ncbi:MULTISPECIES: sensor histidine kinase [Romboutsia]|uniref:histidine kinase n=1 Tax=Romboutsia hominis TaxID=1507512 RepID=A0A2P2BU52_9FIRM|nr:MULTISPECIES: ATP-binding protein [Romboutsia]MDB8792753.1 ATP-binding protein [Romboutsia sp. 1001216sp1]MDB8795445.1 ATP-binding protein [Romboutsia sp. 1001216sp1]MDB8799255.1 ATP-binding protein [Romboutsia sp. 1001216sp1]MDB8804688.1 ATP-binding protein [Romboutsia sp. 1001216sp1]MDB8806388.1 ATP-binding protein [Romboutsia sp. 1001216sp1]
MLNIADITNSIIQSILISYFPYYCLKKEGLISKKDGTIKFILTAIVIFANIIIVTKLIGGTSLSIIIMNILNMVIIACSYFNHYSKAITSYFIIYIIMQMSVIIAGNIHWSYTQDLLNNPELSTILTMYLPMYTIEILILVFKNKIYSIYNIFSRYKYCFEVGVFFVLSFDYILSLSLIIHGNDSVVFKNLIIISCIVFLISLFMYVLSINKKINEIEKLNIALSNKNNELKKIKHDYGSQISYINGLYIMEQYERLGDLLKHIINGNNQVSGNIKIISNENSIITCIVNSFDFKDINIIVEEESDIQNLNISEYDLQKILSNIISNSITALGNNGLIIIKTYKIFNNIYISIKNNGPKIEDKIIDKIFDEGFTTKTDMNKKENGFGLAIVKELVEKNKGKIYVDSNVDYTEFKILFSV